MREETSKQPENTFSQFKRTFAEGKRKEESDVLALSLQDVFSESDTLLAFSRKHLSCSILNRKMRRNLEQKNIGGKTAKTWWTKKNTDN